MLIRWCKQLGITTINFVRRPEQVEELRALGADHVIDLSDKENLMETITQLQKEVSPTCGFDCVGGEIAGAVFETLGRNGKLYIYGSMSGQKICQISPIGLIFMNKSINQHGLKYWLDKKSDWAKSRAVNEAMGLVETILKTDIKDTMKVT
jgi:NADPH:quinone reductase-like Zn-dependent oxidoreductase